MLAPPSPSYPSPRPRSSPAASRPCTRAPRDRRALLVALALPACGGNGGGGATSSSTTSSATTGSGGLLAVDIRLERHMGANFIADGANFIVEGSSIDLFGSGRITAVAPAIKLNGQGASGTPIMSERKIPAWFASLLSVLIVLLVAELIDGLIHDAPRAGAVLGSILLAGVVGFLVVSARNYRRSQNLLEKLSATPGGIAPICQSCGKAQTSVAGTCQRCVATRTTSTGLTPAKAAVPAGAVVLMLLGKIAMEMVERKARSLPGRLFILLLLLEIVAITVFVALARTSAHGSSIASMLSRFIKLDDGHLDDMVLDTVKPADWLNAHWQGTAPEAFLAAVSSDANHWVLSGKVDGSPMMLVCFEQGSKPNPRSAELHLFMAHPRLDRSPGKTELHEGLAALGCEVQLSGLGVYISHDNLNDILSVEQVRVICLSAVELARQAREVTPYS